MMVLNDADKCHLYPYLHKVHEPECFISGPHCLYISRVLLLRVTPAEDLTLYL